MKTTPEALKKLYEALGGASADVENLSLTPDLIEAIAEVAPTGGGGGGFMLVKYYSEDLGEGTQYYSETTVEEIIDAVKEGKNVVAELSLETGLTARLALAGTAEIQGAKVATFVAVGSQNVSNPLILDSYVLFHRRMPGATEDLIEVGSEKGSLTAYN